MPPVARMSLELLESLARERLGATQETVLKDLERLESLAPDLMADKDFPEDWIIYRITGEHRVVRRPALLRGPEILRDLSALSERLSQQARLPRTPDAIELKALASRWNVNIKTIDRYRRQGLLARRLLGDDAKPRLFFSPAAIMRFEELRQAQLIDAGRFERIDEATKANIQRWAAGYRRRLRWSLNQAAGRIAERTGRSREAVRRVLKSVQRYQARTRVTATFAEPAPLTGVQQKVIFRAMIRGGEPALLARRYKKPLGSIQRAWGIARATQLRQLALPARPRVGAAESTSVALTAAPANIGLQITPRRDLAEFLAAAKQPTVPIGVEETARLAAYRELVTRSATSRAKLDHNFPRSSNIDEVFTWLRWAARLKALLIQSQLRLITQNLEASLELELTAIRSTLLRDLLLKAIQAAAEAVDSHAFAQAANRGRVAAPVTLAVNRLAARWEKDHAQEMRSTGAARAAARLLPGVAFPDWTLSIASWQRVVEPDARLRSACDHLCAEHRLFLIMRFGWGNTPPRTLVQCARELNVSSIKIARLERESLQAAYALIASGT